MNNEDFSSLFNKHVNSKYSITQHNSMFNNYVDLLGGVLHGLYNVQWDIEDYKALSYRGLTKTNFWIENIEGTVDETIINSFQAQLLNGRQPCK